LLAEDNPINQKLAVLLLQKSGYSVDAVETGAQALEKVKTNSYRAILMDVQMPIMDGLEATHQIRLLESSNGGHMPIIAMTAHAMQGDRERFLAAGMDDYITKPLEPKVLFSALDRWTHAAEPYTEAAESMQDYASYENVLSANLEDGLFGETAMPVDAQPSRPARAASLMGEAVSSVDTLPVDIEAVLARYEVDEESLLSLLKQFRERLHAGIAEIHAAVQDGNAKLLTRLAHNLKGVSLSFSADALAALAQSLEEMGQLQDLTHAPSQVMQLETEAKRVDIYLRNRGL
jgi:CheY-like chemotaxis protein